MEVVAILSCALALGDAPHDAAAFLETWCLDCHDSNSAKGKIDFQALLPRLKDAKRTPQDADLLRRARIRVADSIMPPADHDQPSAQDRAQILPALNALCAVDAADIVPPATPPRRLNRVEYANTVRDLFGVDIGDLGPLPPDDVGAGFDNVASVLSLSPAAFERMMDIAEAVAQRACPDADPDAPTVRHHPGRDLRLQGNNGQVLGDGVMIWSTGHADRAFDLPRDGLYSITAKVGGMQAGPEVVKIAFVVDGKPAAYFDIAETAKSPGTRTAELPLRGGTHRLGVSFLNDYYVAGPPAQDRNVLVREFTVTGPVDRRTPPEWRTHMEAECASQEQRPAWILKRALRRPCTDADMALLTKVIDPSQSPGEQLRAAIVTALVHPEFLFRVESKPPAGQAAHEVTAHELATRLSYFLWSTAPDAALRIAATDGSLATPAGRATHVARMLRDPRSSQLAERFAPQWLGIDGIDTRMPDAAQFPGVDAALLQSMRSETVLLFDAILRENRPATELLTADYTFVDSRLATHYGLPAPAPGAVRRVPVPSDRSGVLTHAGVLLSTSNPTRTSPVKRGKWVLESLLDCAPPPPPPGAPALPERVEDRHGLTLRQSLEAHRADPSCAACHRRMDALGFAFEHYDAVGRKRDRADGAIIDSVGELPDGRRVASVDDVRALLVKDPDYIRSLAKHLLVYATGRAAGPHDEAAVDLIVASAGNAPTLRELVVAVTESPAFLKRGAGTKE